MEIGNQCISKDTQLRKKKKKKILRLLVPEARYNANPLLNRTQQSIKKEKKRKKRATATLVGIQPEILFP